jgi:hypothetical protein
MLASLRPLLLPSAVDDPPQRVPFVDGVGVTAPGGGAGVEVRYLALAAGRHWQIDRENPR